MSEHTVRASQTCVIGCGGCGSQIAAFFDKIPSILRHRAWHLYPIKCASIDTAQGMETILTKSPWNWHDTEDIHILPTASQENVYRRITGKAAVDSSDLTLKSLQQRWRSGAGQFPFIGTLTAEEYLLKDNLVGRDLRDGFVKREFTQGGLLIVNSLTGGTGTGFAPVISEFFSSFHTSGIILDLSIIPQMASLKQKTQIYPGNIIYGLYKLSQSKRVDAVMLADNEILSQDFNCRGIPQYNSLLHEILTPILLASVGEYDYPNFYKHIDFADMFRILRPDRGMAAAELCALSYAVKRLPCLLLPRFKTKRQKGNYVNKYLSKLMDDAVKKTTVGRIRMSDVKGAVVMLSGPPQFYENFLEDNAEHYQNLLKQAYEKITPNLILGCLKFPDMKQVSLSMILSGVSSPKLEELYYQVIPEAEQKTGATLMGRIRRLNPKMIEDLMIKEIREQLSREMPLDREETV